MMKRQIDGKQRVIAAVIEDIELPPLLDRLTYVNFRDTHANEVAYKPRLADLKRAIDGLTPHERPQPGSPLVVPIGEGIHTEGSIDRTLKITPTDVTLSGGTAAPVSASWSFTPADGDALRHLERERRRPGEIVRKTSAAETEHGPSLHGHLLAFGRRLGECMLANDVGVALVGAIDEAKRRGATMRLGLEIAVDELTTLPWETIIVPNMVDPLVLHRSVDFYRMATGGASVLVDIPGPLRILVCIASPDDDIYEGKLLDVERELSLILDVVDALGHKPYVRVLHGGTAAEISDALMAQRFHVLHVSCHAGPGVLALESDDGSRDPVTAQLFAERVLPPNRRPPLVVLAGCATQQLARPGDNDAADDEAQALSGFAKDLTERGVPGVIAMSATVTDHYATQFCSQLYQHLATAQEPKVLEAVTRARHQVELNRRADEARREAEWATPVFTAHEVTARLVNTVAVAESISNPVAQHLNDAIPIRRVDEFVGRRRELRQIREALKTTTAGVVIRGMGGVGKSTLAARVLDQLAADTGLVIPIVGETDPGKILKELSVRLDTASTNAPVSRRSTLEGLAGKVGAGDRDWQERLAAFRQTFLHELGCSVTLLVDNFEDNLTQTESGWKLKSDDLGEFLAVWARSGDNSRLVVTSRYPFELPNGAHRDLVDVHLGPLSFAETRKLMWPDRLNGLSELARDDKIMAWRMVGGHPRTLEFLDALLRGKTPFAEITQKLAKFGTTLDAKATKPLDVAVAEATALSAADTILQKLVDQVNAVAGAKELLMAASVFRRPVDTTGLTWHQSIEREGHADPSMTLQGLQERFGGGAGFNPENLEPAELEELMSAIQQATDFLSNPRRVAPEHADRLAALLPT